jgi:uncharacterized protein (TIGR02246 family)
MRLMLLIAMVMGAWRAAAQVAPLGGYPDEIRAVITQVNTARGQTDADAFSKLFTSDGELRIGPEIYGNGPSAITEALGKSQVWSEVTPPVIRDETVRFVSADVALVDAVQVQHGSVILRQTTPVTMVLRRESGNWRIVSLRLQPPLGTFPSSAARSR